MVAHAWCSQHDADAADDLGENKKNKMKNSNSTRPQAAVTTQNADQFEAKPGPQRGRKATTIDFADIKSRAEDWILEILGEIAPEGELRGNEYFMLNPHRNDGSLGSFKFNIDKNVYSDFADDDVKGSDIIGLVAFLDDVKPLVAAQKVRKIIDKLELSEQSASTSATVVKVKARAKNAKKLTVPVVPVPAGAPQAPDAHYELGQPTSTYTYTDADDHLLCYVRRFDLPGQRKEFRPQTYRKSPDGQMGWTWLGLDDQRPLYNLRELVTRPNVPVLIVEGEKAADAAKILFPDRVVVTTMGGSQAPDRTDLTPLRDRTVLIWPDNDEAGKKYVDTLTELLREQDPEADISVLRIPGVLASIVDGQPVLTPGFIVPQGWDAADAVAEGWTAGHIQLIPTTDFLKPSLKANVPATMQAGQQDALVSQMPDDVRDFLLHYFKGSLVYTNEVFWGYAEGQWRPLDNAAEVRNPIAYFYGKDATATSIDGLYKLLQAFVAVSKMAFVPDKRMICMRNGTLNTDTYVLDEHSPAHGLVNKLDIDWNEAATCPRWLKFLDEVFVNDTDKDQKIAFLQQWFGYCLTADVSQHKFVWMVGGGGNGKSVLLTVLQELVGVANVGHAQIERFDSASVRAELEGKLLNISSEMSATATISDGYLKAITGGDSIEAERKYKQPHTFKPYVRLIAATNNLPRLLDNSDGFSRRAVILTFNRKFSEQEKDPGLEQTLLKELPGIAVWAIEGLKGLRSAGKFELPASSAIELARYRTESDPVALFAEECLTVSTGRGFSPTYAYDKYQEWSKRSGFQPLNKINFGRRLAALGFEKTRSGGQSYWMVEISELEERTFLAVNKEVTHPCATVRTENSTPSKPPRYKF